MLLQLQLTQGLERCPWLISANSFTLNTDANITLSGTASGLSGVQTLTVSVGDKTADLSGATLGFQDARTVSLSGGGSGSTVILVTYLAVVTL